MQDQSRHRNRKYFIMLNKGSDERWKMILLAMHTVSSLIHCSLIIMIVSLSLPTSRLCFSIAIDDQFSRLLWKKHPFDRYRKVRYHIHIHRQRTFHCYLYLIHLSFRITTCSQLTILRHT